MFCCRWWDTKHSSGFLAVDRPPWASKTWPVVGQVQKYGFNRFTGERWVSSFRDDMRVALLASAPPPPVPVQTRFCPGPKLSHWKWKVPEEGAGFSPLSLKASPVGGKDAQSPFYQLQSLSSLSSSGFSFLDTPPPFGAWATCPQFPRLMDETQTRRMGKTLQGLSALSAAGLRQSALVFSQHSYGATFHASLEW